MIYSENNFCILSARFFSDYDLGHVIPINPTYKLNMFKFIMFSAMGRSKLLLTGLELGYFLILSLIHLNRFRSEILIFGHLLTKSPHFGISQTKGMLFL